MLGMIYLFLAVMLGYEGSKILTEKNNHAGYAANRIWLILPASFGVGMLDAYLDRLYCFVVCKRGGRNKKSSLIWKCSRDDRERDYSASDVYSEI